MIYSSLAVAAMAASSLVASAATPIHLHLHPHQRVVDSRISVVLHNTAHGFRDVTVDGKTYTVEAHHDLTIKAPSGTVVTMSSPTPTYRRGDTITALAPTDDHRVISLD